MRRIAVLLVFLFAPALMALNVADTTVVIPIIGRFPGAGGTQWRTDVFIANPYTPIANITATFYVAGGSPMTSSITVAPFSAVSLADITLNTFGLSNASGQLVLTSASTIEARARIYNAGNPAGQFGQNVPGLGLETLRIQAFMYGLSGINGNRVNIGVANPNAAAATVVVRVKDKNNGTLHTEGFTLQPHETRQVNDVFTAYGIALQDGIQVTYMSDQVIYGYASEVRNDTGDAIFVFGTGPNV
jgi:hypothetical protein